VGESGFVEGDRPRGLGGGGSIIFGGHGSDLSDRLCRGIYTCGLSIQWICGIHQIREWVESRSISTLTPVGKNDSEMSARRYFQLGFDRV
jgi:hypothetical protein